MLDEDEYDELRMFQRCLVDMFAEQDKDVVFLESVMGLSRHPHSAIHCVPLSRDDGAMAPMFFKVGWGTTISRGFYRRASSNQSFSFHTHRKLSSSLTRSGRRTSVS